MANRLGQQAMVNKCPLICSRQLPNTATLRLCSEITHSWWKLTWRSKYIICAGKSTLCYLSENLLPPHALRIWLAVPLVLAHLLHLRHLFVLTNSSVVHYKLRLSSSWVRVLKQLLIVTGQGVGIGIALVLMISNPSQLCSCCCSCLQIEMGVPVELCSNTIMRHVTRT